MSLINRRKFLRNTGLSAADLSMSPSVLSAEKNKKELFKLSLAQWSLHRMLKSGELNNLNFPKYTKETFGIDAVEYVNGFFPNTKSSYIKGLKQRCDDQGVKSLLIMCNGLGHIGDKNATKRKQTVENHKPWLESAQHLGCHSIRVNARSMGTEQEQTEYCIDGLKKLCTVAKQYGINIIIENHGGLSSNGAWLAGVIQGVNMDNCGSLPDFGNFKAYDRYEGTKALMPYAKGVSAKSHEFDGQGNELRTDYHKMLKIVLDADFRGYVGIEYEGKKMGEVEGVNATRDLLLSIRSKYAASYKY